MKKIRNPVLAFCLALGIFLALAAVKGFYPFGEFSILQIDLFHQYAPFQEELRSRILEGKSLIYSWEGGLGKAFLPQLAYYTASPLSFLCLLIPQKGIADFMLFLIGVKLSLAAGCFTCYLEQHFQEENPAALLWGLLYAFSGFMTAYCWNVMWLDDLALFPLVAAGIDRLLRKDDGRLYLGALACAILFNFYVAYLVCVGSVLYVLIQTGCMFRKDQTGLWVKKGVRYAGLSVLAAGLGGFLILPAALALSQTAAGSATLSGFEIYENFWQIGESHLLGAVPQVLSANDKVPNIGCGLLALILALCFFINPGVPKREKAAYGTALLFLLCCCVFRPLDFVIHGMHFPANLPHRFMFIYIFLILSLGYHMWRQREQLTETMIMAAVLLWAGVLLVSEYVIVPARRDLMRLYSEQEIALNLALLSIYGLFVAALIRKEKRRGREKRTGTGKAGFLILLCLITGECFYSGCNGLVRKTSHDNYSKNQEAAARVRQYLDEKEQGDFYRMEFRRFLTINDGALFHYHGLSQFSSMAPGGMSQLMVRLGFSGGSNSYRYYDPTPLLDGIFDISYIIEKTDDGNGGMKNPFYTYTDTIDNLEIYENPRALGPGFVVPHEMEQWDTDKVCPFEVQNEFARRAGLKKDLFTLVHLENIRTVHMEITESDEGYFRYRAEDPYNLEQIPELYGELSVSEEGHYFLWAQTGQAKRLIYEWEGQRQDRELSAGKSLFDLRQIPAGKRLQVTLPFNNRSEHDMKFAETGDLRIYAARYDDEAYQELYELLSREPWTVIRWGDTFLEGEVESREGGILWTCVPWEKGWQAEVNGEICQPVPLGDGGVLGVRLKPGRSTVRLEYHLPGQKAGLALSAAALAISLYFVWGKPYFLINTGKRSKRAGKNNI